MSVTDVLAEYDRIRMQNKNEENRRKQEVYGKIPELKEVFEKKDALQLERIKSALSGNPMDTKEIMALREQANMLLVSAGYDPHYLDPVYTCSMCRDTGTLDNAMRCDCFNKRILEDKLQAAKLTDNGISFEQFDISLFDDTPIENGRSQKDMILKIKKIAEKYSEMFPNCESMFILSGATGLGKTYIAKCIMRRIIQQGHTAAFYTAYRLFSLFHRDRLGESIDLSPIFEVPLLIIDDIGTEPMTRNVTKEYFFDLINERNDNGLHTMIVTNLTFHEIKERYGDRIHSRLMDKYASQKIIFKGRDIRY